MDIGIIGTGNMGRTLGALWARAGHAVVFGAREPEKAEAAARLGGPAAGAGTNVEAARHGDVLVWNPRLADVRAVLGGDPDPVATLAGKVLVDMNNGPIPTDFRFAPVARSFAEDLAASASQSHVVKAFNTIAQEAFEHDPAVLRTSGVSAFLAGDDANAKATVAALAAQLGFAPVDCGPLDRAKMLEGVGDFIRTLMIAQGLGPFATISLHRLPATEVRSLGGRQPTRLT